MRYRVIGVDRETGKDVAFTVEAPYKAAAEKQGNQAGETAGRTGGTLPTKAG
ncbi:MAG: hypothetical protein ACYSVY_11770 [Planctomycetota bacterium]|jgi:hypothetical protein